MLKVRFIYHRYCTCLGQEDGVVGQDGEIRITPFNMQEELEEGHFDKQGMYHWKKEKEIEDNWLENIDWCKVNKHQFNFFFYFKLVW